MSEYECYVIYNALKMHFNSDNYDYVKYNGKFKTSYVTYEKRKDRYYFARLSKLFPHKEDLEYFFISNFISNNKMWIGEALSSEAEDIYKKWRKKIESLNYIFTNDCSNLIDTFNIDDTENKQKNFDKIFEIKGGQHPIILQQSLSNKINLETFIILNHILNFVPKFNAAIIDKIIWPKFIQRAFKYQTFLKYDVKKFKNILIKELDF